MSGSISCSKIEPPLLVNGLLVVGLFGEVPTWENLLLCPGQQLHLFQNHALAGTADH